VVQLRLPFRKPLDLPSMLDYLAARAIPGVESVRGDTYQRTLALPNGAARAEIRPGGDSYLLCRLELAHQRDLVAAVARLRRLLDLDADPAAVDAALGARPELAHLVTEAAGVAIPRALSTASNSRFAVVGQQISVAGADTVLARLVARSGGLSRRTEPAVPHRCRSWRHMSCLRCRCRRHGRRRCARSLRPLAVAQWRSIRELTGPWHGPRFAACPASVRGQPTTLSCGRSAIPTSCSRPTSACDALPAHSISI
jgi:hypothetical protein